MSKTNDVPTCPRCTSTRVRKDAELAWIDGEWRAACEWDCKCLDCGRTCSEDQAWEKLEYPRVKK